MKAIYEPAIAELERDFVVHKPWTKADQRAYIAHECAGARAAVTTPAGSFSRADFEAMPKLEIVCCFGSGYQVIDLAAAKERNIVVTHTPDSTAEPVADLAMGMTIAVMRRLYEADRFVRAGKWPSGVFPSGVEVRGKSLGIVGFGRIGQQIAKRAAAFEMPVCYYGPRRKEGMAYEYFSDLEAMARGVDCLMVTCPLSDATRNLVDRRVLAALGANGFLVNVARGPIVDEDALVAALEARTIAGAALDVFRDEPHVPEALRRLDNVVLAPHIGTSTRDIRDERMRKFVADVRAHFSGGVVRHRVPVE